MEKTNGYQYGEGKKKKWWNWLLRNYIFLASLFLVLIISVGLFYFYGKYPDRIEELKAYGYLGAFVISLILNATVILPVGNIVVLTALGVTLPSAALVGLVGGAGAAIGESVGFLAGYSGRGLIGKEKMYSRVERWMKRWGSLTVFVLSIIPFIFDLVGIAAGALKFPYWKFLILCWLGRTILYVAFIMGIKIMIP